MLESLYMDGQALLEPNNPDNWLTPEVEGLEAPIYRESFEERSGEHGAFMHHQFYGGRVVALPGVLQADDPATFARRRRELIALCGITHDSHGRPIPKHFTGTTLDGVPIYFDGFTRRPVFGSQSPVYCTFMIPVVTPDPNIYLQASVSSGQVTVLSSGGVEWPVTWPAVWGTSSGGSVAVQHDGTADVWPVITLRGGLTEPLIYHDGQAVSLGIAYTLGASDTAVIDMKEKTITLNGTSNLMPYRTSDSDWFSLNPDINLIRLETATTGDTGSMEITFNPALLGI